MPRDSKNENDGTEPYRRYRVPDHTATESAVEDAQAEDDGLNTGAVVFTIVLSLLSVGIYVAIFGVILLVLASMLGLID